jgi:uncharacterized protein YukE
MADMIGADPNELRNLAAQMRGAADELDGHSSALTSLLGSVDWVGDFASRFLSSWSGGHRVRLQSTSQFIRDAASELERNADEQVNASNSAGSGRGFAGGGGGAGAAGGQSLPQVRSVNDLLTMGGAGLGTLGDARNLDWARTGGHVFQAAGYFVDGYAIGDDLAHGRYDDATFGGLFMTGDLAADGFKASATPHGYLAGVTIQAWTQVGRAAHDIDWSPQGMQMIRDASLDDWVDAFGDSLTQMPVQLVKIFSL